MDNINHYLIQNGKLLESKILNLSNTLINLQSHKFLRNFLFPMCQKLLRFMIAGIRQPSVLFKLCINISKHGSFTKQSIQSNLIFQTILILLKIQWIWVLSKLNFLLMNTPRCKTLSMMFLSYLITAYFTTESQHK